MAKRIYVIMGATGNIGHVVCEELLARGHHVRALGRSKPKLLALANKGAETITAREYDVEEVLDKAFQGATAVFTFVPPAYQVSNYADYQDRESTAIVNALKKNRIPYVVNLSSVGAQLPAGTGPVKGLHRLEEKLNTLTDANVLHLRPAYFMENLRWFMPIVQRDGILGSALRGDIPIPFVATHDIGAKAAEFLDRLNFTGHPVFEFYGPREITMTEAAHIVGMTFGISDMPYKQFPYEGVQKGMIEGGIQPDAAALLIEMYRSINDGTFKGTQEITAEHRGTTSLEEFSKTLTK